LNGNPAVIGLRGVYPALDAGLTQPTGLFVKLEFHVKPGSRLEDLVGPYAHAGVREVTERCFRSYFTMLLKPTLLLILFSLPAMAVIVTGEFEEITRIAR